MLDWYTRHYAALPTSRAHAALAEETLGRDLGQHGFADMRSLDALATAHALQPGERVRDLGCGDGRIAEYVSDTTGATVLGVDFIAGAIEQAKSRTIGKRDRYLARPSAR